jgi:hypothetical protein
MVIISTSNTDLFYQTKDCISILVTTADTESFEK